VDYPSERRKCPRIVVFFQVALTRADETWEIEAVTHDISQTGSLILTPDWHNFTQGVRTNLRFFLPPDFTGHPGTLMLQGPGVVRRLDAERSGIGIEFVRPLRTFDPSRHVQT
jgi:PilZ domain